MTAQDNISAPDRDNEWIIEQSLMSKPRMKSASIMMLVVGALFGSFSLVYLAGVDTLGSIGFCVLGGLFMFCGLWGLLFGKPTLLKLSRTHIVTVRNGKTRVLCPLLEIDRVEEDMMDGEVRFKRIGHTWSLLTMEKRSFESDAQRQEFLRAVRSAIARVKGEPDGAGAPDTGVQ